MLCGHFPWGVFKWWDTSPSPTLAPHATEQSKTYPDTKFPINNLYLWLNRCILLCMLSNSFRGGTAGWMTESPGDKFRCYEYHSPDFTKAPGPHLQLPRDTKAWSGSAALGLCHARGRMGWSCTSAVSLEQVILPLVCPGSSLCLLAMGSPWGEEAWLNHLAQLKSVPVFQRSSI